MFKDSRLFDFSIEQALLSCLIIGDFENFSACLDRKITSKSFYKTKHQEMFQIITCLYSENTEIDEHVFFMRCSEKNIEQDYVFEVINKADTPLSLPKYIEILKDFEKNRLIASKIKHHIELLNGDLPTSDVIKGMQNDFLALEEENFKTSVKSPEDLEPKVVDLIKSYISGDFSQTGIMSGFKEIDGIIGGFKNSEVIIIAARTSVGKTAIGLNIVENIVLQDDPKTVLFFSLEMNAEQLLLRMISSNADVNIARLKDGIVSDEKKKKIWASWNKFKTSPLIIDDNNEQTVASIVARCRSAKRQSKNGLGLILIDYLQLVTGPAKMDREKQVAYISRNLKKLAGELDVPIVALCQLNRNSDVENRYPRLSDLRESGSIEQDADVVILLSKKIKPKLQSRTSYGYCNSQESPEEDEEKMDCVPRKVIVAKQRNGPVGSAMMTFKKSRAKFLSNHK